MAGVNVVPAAAELLRGACTALSEARALVALYAYNSPQTPKHTTSLFVSLFHFQELDNFEKHWLFLMAEHD